MEGGVDIRGPACGLLAAGFFGLSAPLGKLLVADAGPFALASVFYLSAGVVLAAVARLRRPSREAPLQRGDVPALVAIVVLGGILAPALMLYGLSHVSGVTGALFLNLEAPATIVLAVGLFGEHLGARERLAAALVIAGAALLGLAPATDGPGGARTGMLALGGACAAWGLDNNLTQRLSLRDPVALVRVKALSAGAGSFLIALVRGEVFRIRSTSCVTDPRRETRYRLSSCSARSRASSAARNGLAASRC